MTLRIIVLMVVKLNSRRITPVRELILMLILRSPILIYEALYMPSLGTWPKVLVFGPTEPFYQSFREAEFLEGGQALFTVDRSPFSVLRSPFSVLPLLASASALRILVSPGVLNS